MNMIRNTSNFQPAPTDEFMNKKVCSAEIRKSQNSFSQHECHPRNKINKVLLPEIIEETLSQLQSSKFESTNSPQFKNKTTISQENLNSQDSITDRDNLTNCFNTETDIPKDFLCECTHSSESFVSYNACLNDTSDFPPNKNENLRWKRELACQGYTLQSVTEAIMARETPVLKEILKKKMSNSSQPTN